MKKSRPILLRISIRVLLTRADLMALEILESELSWLRNKFRKLRIKLMFLGSIANDGTTDPPIPYIKYIYNLYTSVSSYRAGLELAKGLKIIQIG